MVSTLLNQGIFSGSGAKPSGDRQPVYVGSGGASSFLAVAAGLTDLFISQRHSLSNTLMKELLQKVITRHLGYFSHHRPRAVGLQTPQERMQQILNQLNLSEFVPALAYTLRQIAVDELCANPKEYHHAFLGSYEGITLEMMRQHNTPLDKTALAALANALPCFIQLQEIEDGKIGEEPIYFGALASHPKVVLHLQHGYYVPILRNDAKFKSIHWRAEEVFPDNPHESKDPDLTELIEKIRQDKENLLTKYRAVKHNLETMVAAGDLNKTNLIDIYIQGIQDSLSRTNYIGTQYGTQAFWSSLHPQQGEEVASAEEETYMLNRLIEAIARADSLGYFDVESILGHVLDISSDQVKAGHKDTMNLQEGIESSIRYSS